MTLKSRLLTSALVLPLTGLLVLAPVLAFEVTGDEDDTEATTEQIISANPAGTKVQSITIDGTPSNPAQQAALLIDQDADVSIAGNITVRDRDDDDEATAEPLQNGIAIKVFDPLLTGSLRLKDGASLNVIEVRGPDYDGNSDGLPDANDTDEDGIIEGSPALSGGKRRIGLWVDANISTDLIGESGSSITVEGTGGTDDSGNIVAGVYINGDLSSNLDLSTNITVIGDNARGVNLNNPIGGNYRQRGSVNVRGDDSVALDIDGAISGSLMIEGAIQATGYSLPILPTRGGLDSDTAQEFDADQQTANPNERRTSGSAVDIAASVSGGVLINGNMNGLSTPDEREALSDINDLRVDDDGNFVSVVANKTKPYHFDPNRNTGSITSFGEADGEAALKISETIGSLNGATKETFLDTTNDDGEDLPSDDNGNTPRDVYDSTQVFYYSHGLMNRGSISANSQYDGVKKGAYEIKTQATAILLDDGVASRVLHGGIYNSGAISATAYNGDATAIDIADMELTDGLRGDSTLLLNEGTISAAIRTHTKSHDTITNASKSAIGVNIGALAAAHIADASAAAMVLNNRGIVRVSSSHSQLTPSDADAADLYESIAGQNAIAFELSAVSGPLNLVQEMRKQDTVIQANVDGVAGNEDVYSGGGDIDIDRTGDVEKNADGINVAKADGRIDERDLGALPSITGDVNFGSGDNEFKLLAGNMRGNISFGGGADSLLIGNSIDDDANSEDDIDGNEYTAPVTTFVGAIQKGAGSLTIALGGQDANIAAEKTQLHFVRQEGRDLNADGDDADVGEDLEGLDIASLTLGEKADLRFTVSPEFLTGAILDVDSLSIGADATISPFITSLPGVDGNGDFEIRTIKLIESSSDLSSLNISDSLQEEGHPYIYNVSLEVDTTGAKDVIQADFAIKTASELGLNATEGSAWPAVISHFRSDETLEAVLSLITDGDEFDAYYDQLLPQYGDGTMKQLASLSEAATGAVGQHLQIVGAGGRRDGDGWVQQFGDYRKQDATQETDTVSGTSYGMALGYDAPAGFAEAVGMYAQMSFTSVHEKPSLLPNAIAPGRDEVKAESFGVGAYMADKIGPVRYELSAAAGSIAFDSLRSVQFNGVSDVLAAAWDGASTSASARVIYPILEDDHLLRIEAGRDYFSLKQDDYTERTLLTVGRDLALRVRGGNSDMTSDYIGVRGSLVRGGGSPSDIVWEPNYYLGFRSVDNYSAYSAKANFVGNDVVFDLKSQDEISDTTELGLGVAAHNDYFAFEFNYRGKFGDGEEVHGGGISVRLLF